MTLHPLASKQRNIFSQRFVCHRAKDEKEEKEEKKEENPDNPRDMDLD